MRFIPLLSGQTGHSLFFRLTLLVDIGGDKSSRINTSFSSHWFAHTTSPSSHPEVLPPRWPLSVTCGCCSFIYLHIVPIHFTGWRQWHCTVRGLMMSWGGEGIDRQWVLFTLYISYVWTVQLIFVEAAHHRSLKSQSQTWTPEIKTENPTSRPN